MTDDDPFLDRRFVAEVRQMLHRRAADVADDDRAILVARPPGPTESGPVGPRPPRVPTQPGPVGPRATADVLALPGAETGLSRSGREIPWLRRAGLLTAAAVVLAVVGYGVADWLDRPQQVVVGPAEGAPNVALVPPDGDAVVAGRFQVLPAEALGLGPSVVEYGPDDGPASEGVLVVSDWTDDIDPLAGPPMPGESPVTDDQSGILATLGAFFDGRSTVSWTDVDPDPEPGTEPGGPARSIVVAWYGSALSTDQGLAIAAAVATSPDRSLDGTTLPEGWSQRQRYDGPGVPAPGSLVSLTGAFEGAIRMVPVELPLGMFAVDWEIASDSLSVEEVELRGATGLLVTANVADGPEAALDMVWLVWHEGGATYQLMSFDPAVPPTALVELAERLVAVDLNTIAPQVDAPTDRPGETRPDMTVTSTETPMTSGTEGGVGFPPVSLTAPGPGAVGAPAGGSTRTTGPAGGSAGTATTTGAGTATTSDAGTPTTPTTTIPSWPRPAGDFTDNSIVPVQASTIGRRPYEVGVSWSPTFGFCMGVDLDGSITDGGYPVICEVEPLVGGGDRQWVPGVGTVVYAFADASTARATLGVGGATHEATVHRVDEFPQFAFVVFALEGVSVEAVDRLALPGHIALFDAGGQPVGWG